MSTPKRRRRRSPFARETALAALIAIAALAAIPAAATAEDPVFTTRGNWPAVLEQ